MKYLDSDGLMRFSSRLLDIALVRKAMVAGMKQNILKTLSDTPPPSLLDRFRALAGKAA
jgi:hypothetical protein